MDSLRFASLRLGCWACSSRPVEGAGGERKTIAEKLASKYGTEKNEYTVPLGLRKELDIKPLTVSQRRNIRRQKYLDEVSKRNDVPFFAVLGLAILVPPIIILGFAFVYGYIDLKL